MTNAESDLLLALRITGNEGYVDIGLDRYGGDHWPSRSDLPLLGRVMLDIEGHEQQRVAVEVRQLPNGDALVIRDGLSFRRLSRDPDAVIDFRARSAIWGHQYDPSLVAAIIDIERKSPFLSWFGGAGELSTIAATGARATNTSGSLTRTGPEMVEALKEWIGKIVARYPEWSEARTAADLATDASITAIPRQGK
jgi:hypothetical protein